MGKKRETLLKEKVMSCLAAQEQCWIVKTQQVARRGIPDLVICWRGWFIAIELKTDDPGSKLDELQSVELAEIMAAGGVGVAVDETSWPSVLSELAKMVGADGKARRKGKRK